MDGHVKQKKLGAEALLDFKLGITLGDETLTEYELQALLAAQEELVFIKGQWVEVDRKKLAEALAHWKKVEVSVGGDGLTFAEGMRLLAGNSVAGLAGIDLVLTTYGMVLRQSWLQARDWCLPPLCASSKSVTIHHYCWAMVAMILSTAENSPGWPSCVRSPHRSTQQCTGPQVRLPGHSGRKDRCADNRKDIIGR